MPIINRVGGGAGGGAFSATLTVTTSAGASISATSSSAEKTFTGTVGSDGKCVLTITAPGTYDVTATLNGATVTGSVVVADTEANYLLVLSFWDGVLYNAGDSCEDVTGGWINHSGASLTLGSSSMTWTGTAGNIRTQNAVDLSKYSTLKVTFTSVNKRAGFAVVTPENLNGFKFTGSGQDGTPAAICTHAETTGTRTLDITNVNTAVYIVLGVGSSSGGSATVTKIWAE